mmetsp:Transcript_61664/g.145740  ORF Transcript_61664/g.145740 Transcript_61664/m.145740 type:complete len:206 (-) Transcript_61664:2259-2876(-)
MAATTWPAGVVGSHGEPATGTQLSKLSCGNAKPDVSPRSSWAKPNELATGSRAVTMWRPEERQSSLRTTPRRLERTEKVAPRAELGVAISARKVGSRRRGSAASTAAASARRAAGTTCAPLLCGASACSLASVTERRTPNNGSPVSGPAAATASNAAMTFCLPSAMFWTPTVSSTSVVGRSLSGPTRHSLRACAGSHPCSSMRRR